MNPEEYARMHALESEYWWFAGRRAIIASLLRVVRERQGFDGGLNLLDIGCGTGANLPMLQTAVGEDGHVTGMDFSPLALKFARDHLTRRTEYSQAPVALLQGDASHLPFPDDTFDVVTMLDVLEHLEDDTGALREVLRVLKNGGAFVWSVPAYQHLWSAHDEALHHFRRYERRGLQRLLRAVGFRAHRISFAMSLMPPAAWFWRRFILPFQPHRPRHAKRHSQGAVLPPLPPFLNHAFTAYLGLEGRIIRRRPLKFGTSLVGIAVKDN